MKASERVPVPVMAAGGIVVREAARPLIAVVRLRKDKAWVLPKGKLKPGESAVAAAKREAQEETGHNVAVHEFLGSMSHATDGRHKIVQFWRMTPVSGPARALGSDVTTVKWLPLKQAIETLTRPHERVFLANVGAAAVKATRHASRRVPVEAPASPVASEPPELLARSGVVDTVRAWLRFATSRVARSN
jgi:8-oxo-dGTP diphosphatase